VRACDIAATVSEEVTEPGESPAAALDADYTHVTNWREFRDTRNRTGWDAGPVWG